VTAKLGTATDTGDADGSETIDTAEVPNLSFEEWNDVLQEFLGESMQVPPMYSALKKDGKRLYELARQGEVVEREPRKIRIDEIRLLEAAGTRLVFRVTCSKGTYVRTLVEDIAKKAGTVAHTARLHRESVGDFRAEDMLDLASVEASIDDDREGFRASLLGPDVALTGFPAIELDVSESKRFSGGQAVQVVEDGMKGLARVYEAGSRFLGVGELSGDGWLAPRRVFLTQENPPN
jgi:tRNA pseudouridine55 synthase